MRKKMGIAVALTAFAALVLPAAASAETVAETVAGKATELDMVWVAVACVLVFLMQAGFMFLEIGFSRQKNAGTGVAKILVNFAIVTIAWWALGYGVAEGGGNDFFGTSGFFFHFDQVVGQGEEAFNVAGSDAMLMLYGLAFCAVSLAIVWGTTLERIKFGAYVIYAIVFGAVIYPLIAHAVWGGGLLSDIGGKPVMDFAGSSVVHLTGAVGALAALLLLGPRIGKYDADGKPRAIPGHSMPLVGLGVIILWIGWFGFNGGSTFETASSFFGEVMLNTQLAAAAGVIGASLAVWLKSRTLDVGMAGNGAIAGLVGITAPSGFVEYWAAPIIGFIAGLIVVYAVLAIDKLLDDPVGALSAHGLAGIWGTLAVGIFASPRLIVEGAGPGIWYGIFGDASFSTAIGQLGVQGVAVVFTFVVVFTISIATFALIKATIGLRVPTEEEDAGLDISSHGMYGYPEQFIPQPEYSTGMPNTMGGVAPAPVAAPAQMTATESR
ncbi:MAG TPA: ammonium transporter [Solirubrobacterales bacterium]|jgi:Amt family ammonium transporter|nr:ammonium transporter [Solirubrobacterales bacterium]